MRSPRYRSLAKCVLFLASMWVTVGFSQYPATPAINPPSPSPCIQGLTPFVDADGWNYWTDENGFQYVLKSDLDGGPVNWAIYNPSGEPHNHGTYSSPGTGPTPAGGALPIRHILTTEEVEAINSYANPFGYREINNFLRGNSSDVYTPDEIARLREYIDEITVALEKLPAYEGTVHRGVRMTPQMLRILQPGNEWTELGFTSSSLRRSYDSRDIQMTIRSKTGRVLGDVVPPSDHHMAEVLFAPNTRFRVVSVTEQNGITHAVVEEV